MNIGPKFSSPAARLRAPAAGWEPFDSRPLTEERMVHARYCVQDPTDRFFRGMFGNRSSVALKAVVLMPCLRPAKLDHRQRPTREWFFLPCHHSREMSSRLVCVMLCVPHFALQMVRLSIWHLHTQ